MADLDFDLNPGVEVFVITHSQGKDLVKSGTFDKLYCSTGRNSKYRVFVDGESEVFNRNAIFTDRQEALRVLGGILRNQLSRATAEQERIQSQLADLEAIK